MTLAEFNDLSERVLRRLADDVDAPPDAPFIATVASFPGQPGREHGYGMAQDVTSATGYAFHGRTGHQEGQGNLVEIAFPDACWEHLGCDVNVADARCGRYVSHTAIHVEGVLRDVGQKRVFDDYAAGARALTALAACAAGVPRTVSEVPELRGRPVPEALEEARFGVCRRCAVCLRWDVARGCCTVCGGPLAPTPNPGVLRTSLMPPG